MIIVSQNASSTLPTNAFNFCRTRVRRDSTLRGCSRTPQRPRRTRRPEWRRPACGHQVKTPLRGLGSFRLERSLARDLSPCPRDGLQRARSLVCGFFHSQSEEPAVT